MIYTYTDDDNHEMSSRTRAASFFGPKEVNILTGKHFMTLAHQKRRSQVDVWGYLAPSRRAALFPWQDGPCASIAQQVE